jgi:hypothetical protein
MHSTTNPDVSPVRGLGSPGTLPEPGAFARTYLFVLTETMLNE